MTMRGSQRPLLPVASLAGVILFIVLVFPGAYTFSFLDLSVEGGNDPGNTLVVRSGPDSNTTCPSELTDDEKLESLIARASIPLLEVSVESIYSMYRSDDMAVRNLATEISSLVDSYRAEAATLDASPAMAPSYEHFTAALDEFSRAGILLNGNRPLSQSMADDALRHLGLGIERLSQAMQDCNRSHIEHSKAPVDMMSLAAEPASLFSDALSIGERYRYDEQRGENAISLIVGPITWSKAFQTTGTKPVQYVAGSGKAYLLVAVEVTHLGHKGNGANTRIQTPGESAFVLHYAGETYHPLKAPGSTTRGGSYSRVMLDRHESVGGYLFFEVPDGLDPARAYLQVNIGGESVVWNLGRVSLP